MLLPVKARSGKGLVADRQALIKALKGCQADALTFRLGRKVEVSRKVLLAVFRELEGEDVTIAPAWAGVTEDKAQDWRYRNHPTPWEPWPSWEQLAPGSYKAPALIIKSGRDKLRLYDGAALPRAFYKLEKLERETVVIARGPRPQGDDRAAASPVALAKGLGLVAACVAQQGYRPALQGILAQGDGETLTLIGCDGYRMAWAEVVCRIKGRWLLSARQARAIAQAATLGVIRLTPQGQGLQVTAANGDTLLWKAHRDPAEYPDYGGLVPSWKKATVRAKVEAKALARILRGMGRDGLACLKLKDGRVTITHQLEGEKEQEAVIDGQGQGEALAGFTVKNLLGIVGNIGDWVELGMVHPTAKPILLRGPAGQAGVMPCAVNGAYIKSAKETA